MLNIEETANTLKVSQSTVRRLLKSGELEGFKAGRAYRIKPNSLENYISTQTEKEKNHGKH